MQKAQIILMVLMSLNSLSKITTQLFSLTLKLSFYPIIYFNSQISTINPILYLTTLSLYVVGLLYHVSEVIISSVWSNFSIFKAGLGLDANFPHTVHYIPLSNCKIFDNFCNLMKYSTISLKKRAWCLIILLFIKAS